VADLKARTCRSPQSGTKCSPKTERSAAQAHAPHDPGDRRFPRFDPDLDPNLDLNPDRDRRGVHHAPGDGVHENFRGRG
jgi:hypothetical protein